MSSFSRASAQPRTLRRPNWRHVAIGTLLVFAVSLAVVSLVGVLVRALGASDGSNAVDTRVLEWMIDRRSDGLTSVMRTVTALGGTFVLVPLAIVGVVVLVAM
jgi:ABC-type Fe3+ transport system permease subunit